MSEIRSTLAFIAILFSVAATVLESMAVSVALPAISADFDVSASGATWVIAISQFVIVALLLPMAALGEVVGYRRVFLTSLSVFCISTLACFLAPSFSVLVVARAVQAVGTAGAMSLGFAMARLVFPDGRIGTAVGIIAATVAISSSIGPAVAGLILVAFDWRGVFALMLVFSLFAVIFGALTLPPNQPSNKPYDYPDAALVAFVLAALLWWINGLANGWPGATLFPAALIAVVGMVLIVRRSRGKPSPVFPVDLLARPTFALSIAASICAFVAQSIGFILLPFYLIFGAGMNALEMALTLSVWPAATAVLAPVLGRFSDRISAGPAGAAGLLIMAAGFLWLAFLDKDASAVEIAVRFAVCGVGFALFQTPNNRLIILSAPRERSGAASGSLSLARQIGRAIGTAIAAYVLATGTPSTSLEAMMIGAILAVLGATLSFARRKI